MLISILFISCLTIPSNANASGWMDELRIHSVSLLNDGNNIITFTNNWQAMQLDYQETLTIDQIIIVVWFIPETPGIGAGVADVRLLMYSPGNTIGYAPVHYPDIEPPEYPWNGHNVTLELINYNGVWYNEMTVYDNFTHDYTFVYAGNTKIVVWYTMDNPSLPAGDAWTLFISKLPVAQDTFGISENIIYFAWILIIFLPAILLNSVLPKIGFIGGIITMSVVLTATGVINQWWVFLTLLMGIVVLIFRGDEN